ncbi:D-alanyl-D-alanine carboxypeptidase [Paenibacillus sp. UNC496MF]|uniref:M15 family metallopeptidase n=1 Tax=Paenibacillus sp. UNC496MF TaxID=1502753 RepID=UPI0008E234A7|nr:M15 family metallopeptidase [Paenibacillus sp. UNC496MF]SFJ51648.1 D-alanyl-D-alanine carboxypeptidase [Paenibacillus sp. UNC496MF]
MRKSALIPVVVLGIALGTAVIATQTTLLQPAYDRFFGDSASAGAGNDAAPGSGEKPNADTGQTAGAPAKGNPPAKPASAAGRSELQQFLYDNAASRTTVTRSGVAYVTNPTSVLVLVNKKRELDPGYVPPDLEKAPVEFSFSGDSPKQQMRKVAAEALGKLFAGAEQDGVELKAVSGYRSYASQKSIFNAYAKSHGEEEANTFSAHPGQSEHQTGLAMDVSSASVHYGLEESYGETKEGKWLKEHAAEYGFIIRFEKGKEQETGYMYEPWHVRYVGVAVAKDVHKLGLTLEAYLARF